MRKHVREIVCARLGPSGEPSLFSAGLDTGRTHARLVPVSSELEQLALESLWPGRPLLDQVPPSRRLFAQVEAGVVQEGKQAANWAMAVAGGTVVMGQGWSEIAFPWSGETPDAASPELPIVLGPSTVLALVGLLLDWACSTGQRMRWPSGLKVQQSQGSSYPLQDRVGPAAGLLRAAGTTADGALYNHLRGNLRIEHCGTTDVSFPHVRVDALYPLRQLYDGPLPCLLELDLVESGSRLAMIKPLECTLTPLSLLRACQGACGPTTLAVERDPILGATLAEASPLVTGLTLAELGGYSQ